MAWGYWTCYSYNSVQNAVANTRRNLQQNNEQLFYHNKKQPRERSQERSESRLLIGNSNSAGGSSDNSSGKIIHNNKNSITTQNTAAAVSENHHVEPEKVAFERRLLLGDPDWGSRTIADRNTLPRKKQPEYDKNSDAIYGSSAANSSRGRRGSSKMAGGNSETPPDSLSHKSQDDNFCPACAQNSNRESRVSFGSSSRDSSNRPPGTRGRSRSQDDDDYSSDARGNALSSSLPTPPPPPFCSQRDLMRHQASLLETINQKMAFLSAFKLPPHPNKQQLVAAQAAMVQASPKYNTIGPSASAYYFDSSREEHGQQPHLNQQRTTSSRGYHQDLELPHHQQQGGGGATHGSSSGGAGHGHHQQTQHQSSRDSSAKKSRSSQHHHQHHGGQQQPQHSREVAGDKTASREHSSSSLHSLGQRQRDCDNRQTRSSNPSRRTSRSGSRTPRSSRGSRESMGSRGSRGSSSRNKHCHSSKSIDLSDLHPPEEHLHHHDNRQASNHHHYHHRRRSRSRDHEADLEDDPDEDGGEAGDEADGDSDVRPISKPSLPPKPTLVNPPVSFNDTNVKRSESENSLHLAASIVVPRQPVTPAPAATATSSSSSAAAKASDHWSVKDSNHSDLHEGSGTVRRRSRGQRSASSNNNSRPQSTGEDLLSPASAAAAAAASNSSSIPLGAPCPPPPPPLLPPSSSTNVTTVTVEANSHRSSLSQTPEDEDDLEEEEDCESSPSRQRPSRRSSSRRSCLKEPTNSFDHHHQQPQAASASTSQNSPKHFRPFDHKEAAVAGLKYNLFSPPHAPAAPALKGNLVTSEATPSRGATFYSRPRSASIGNRLSDAEPEIDQMDNASGDRGSHHAHYHHHYRHRRHHTLDGHHAHGVSHFEDVEEASFKGAASSRSISSKSEKSSNSRSSHSPSADYDKIFPGLPSAPGMPCHGEDKSIYRRGARRWRKVYKVNGHIFQAKRFNRRAFCAYCGDRIWGLGRQGFKCTQCKLLIHKKCHKLIRVACDDQKVREYEAGIENRHGGDRGGSSTRRGQGNGASALQEIMDETTTEVSPIEPTKEPADSKAISIADFDLIRVIGRGSYAKVLMVELKKTRRLYAMKVIKKELVTDDEDIDWVQTEKHVFETASNHPFLVGLHSCFQTPSRLFFVIEFVRGGDLMFHMQRQRRLPEEHARFYSAEICLALNFLHTRGIIYRDLKLDNVLLDHEGHIKLTDYGMCKENIRHGETTSTFCGTPNYIAPEILRGEDYSFSVDWWALGVLLYEMLAGRSPFDVVGATENPDQNTEDYLFQVILEKTIRIPRSLSVKAASILKGFLNKNPVDRLGCNSDAGFTEIMTHQFFKSIEWELLEQKQIPPPYRPRLENDRDLANFPPEFTDEPVQLTPDDQSVIGKIDQTEFDGFEYVNPLLMSAEDKV